MHSIGFRGGLRQSRFGFLVLATIVAFLAFHAKAGADQVICQAGSEAEHCTAPTGVAVDRTDGLLYVADNGNKQVDVFDADDGSHLSSFSTSFLTGVSLAGIAVDNNPASPAHHDVYLLATDSSDPENNRVVKLDATAGGALSFVKAFAEGGFVNQPKIAVGPGGVVHVADTPSLGSGDRRVWRFDHEGNPLASCVPLAKPAPEEFGGNLKGFAVDSAGNFYIASAGGRPIWKFNAGCAVLSPPSPFHTSFNIQTLALDDGDDVFVSDSTEAATSIYRYDAAATLLKVIYGDGMLKVQPISLAPFSSAGGDVFAAEQGATGQVVHVDFPPPGPVVHPDPELTFAGPIGNTKATLHTNINPEGKATKYRFEYVDDVSYDSEGGFESANVESTAEFDVAPPGAGPGILPIPALFRLAPASSEIGCAEPENPPQPGCLEPSTEYHFRAVAINADGESVGPASTFKTEPPFDIIEVWASDVGIDAAKVHAKVNPLNIPASGHFQYVDEATYLEDVGKGGNGFEHALASETVDFGLGEAPVIRSGQLHSLKAGSAYRYRIVVTNVFGSSADKQGEFTTFGVGTIPPCPNDELRLGPSAGLPDCRAYEMVSPPDKGGGDIAVLDGPIDGFVAELNQSAAAVSGEGWGITYSSVRAFGDAISATFASQYMASRQPVGHPEEGWRSHGISPPREGANFLISSGVGRDTQYKAFSEDLGQAWLRSDSEPLLDEGAIEGFPNLYRRDNASEDYEAICPVEPPSAKADAYVPEPQGFSADGEVTVFRAGDKLTGDASSADNFQLYGCSGEALEAISVLPAGEGGAATGGNAAAGTARNTFGDHRELNLHNAVAADGERVYWTDSGGADRGPGKIYLRERPFAAGGECSGPAAPCTVAVSGPLSAEAAEFWTAAPDGSVAIFSFAAGALAGNLYEFDAGSATSELIAEGVSGVAGFSEDAARLYLVSTKALASGAVSGEENLYLYEAGEASPFRLVATLPGGTKVGSHCEMTDTNPGFRCSRATADGLALAFMSQDPLTGYDNVDAASGEADAEVFLYDVTANGGEGELLCVSCNPSGGRPRGRAVRVPVGSGPDDWLAAKIPGWQSAFHASRALSADGRRLFFDSYDALVPADTNGALDVYQWQRAGKGGCDEGDHDHFPSNGGCLALISSGRGPQDSRFVDASADGSDVFFKTSQSLWPEDPGLIDIYDARVQGGFPYPPVPQAACEGEACQSPPAPPQAPTPASSSFQGDANPRVRAAKRCPKGKRRVTRKGKSRCVAKKRRGGR